VVHAAEIADGEGSVVRKDAARGRIWVLGLDDVRVYDVTDRKLLRRIELPGWSVLADACEPDIALHPSGSAFVSGNAEAKLWRIDVDTLDVTAHEITLRGKEHWAVGFGALVFASNQTAYALTSSVGSVWKIDLASASATMIDRNDPIVPHCAFTPQFLTAFEDAAKPWTRE
jgi:hypothetical protein